MGVLDSSYIKALGAKSAGLKKIFLVFQDTLVKMLKLRREVPWIQWLRPLIKSSPKSPTSFISSYKIQASSETTQKKSPWKKGHSSYCFQGYFNNNNHILEDFHHISRLGMKKMAWFCRFGAFLMPVCEQLVHRQLRFPVLHQVAAVPHSRSEVF